MLQKFALSLKTKTIEFFAEEDEEEEEGFKPIDLDAPATEEVITDQRVVVLKPDAPKRPTRPPPDHVLSSIFTSLSSFHAAYLQLQAAHEPFDPAGIEAADRTAVSHLRRLSDVSKVYSGLPKTSTLNIALASPSEAQVEENQSKLRMFETVFNRLQADIDRKDAEVMGLKEKLKGIEACTSLLERKLERPCCSYLVKEEKAYLNVGVFDSVFKECCRASHRFTKLFINSMTKSGWDLELAANSIYPNVDFAKRGHCRYAVLSYVCLKMFDGFGGNSFGLERNEVRPNGPLELKSQKRDYLNELIEHLTVDAVDLLDTRPSCDFTSFCDDKYQELINLNMEVSLFGELEGRDRALGFGLRSSNLYEAFITMCSAIWMLHKLVLAFDRPVDIFQVRHGTDFSMVYMENILRKPGLKRPFSTEIKQKVKFTVFPGFLVGHMIIQCRVYLSYIKSISSSDIQ